MITIVIVTITILLSNFTYGNNIIDIKREREIEELERLKKRKNKESKEESIDMGEDVYDNCIDNYNNIKLEGNTIYSTKRLYNKFVKFDNNCITKKNLQNIRDNINNFYMANGYLNCRVYFSVKKDKNTILLVINEGKINKINSNSKLQVLTAFPFKKKDRVFNIKEFNQGLDQMNRLQSNNIKLEIKPSNKIGYSDINLVNHNTNKRTIFFGIKYDNGTGKNRLGFNIIKDNLLYINDNIYLSYNTTNPEIKRERNYYYDQIYANISIPLGYYTISFSYSNSKYENNNGKNNTIVAKNNTDNFTYSIEKIVFMYYNLYKNSIILELEDSNNKNYINGTLININSRRLYNVKIHFNNIFYVNNGIISIKSTFQKGIKDNRYVYSYYNLYKLFIYYSNRFNNILSYSLNINSQYTKNNLYGDNKLALGGNSTIRGYDNIVLQSNSGLYIRNDIKINNPLYFIKRLQLNIFTDYGYVTNDKRKLDNNDNNNIFGLGIGLRYLGKYINFEVSYSKGLWISRNDKSNNEFIYFKIGMEI